MIRFSLISATAAVMVVLCAGAADAQREDEIEQVTRTLPTLNPGQTAWVSTLWRGASTDATSFELTARGDDGITITYPENTGSYSSLYKQSTLLAGDTDYAALKVQVDGDVRGDEEIRLTVRYELDGERETDREEVDLPIEVFRGPEVEQVTTSVGAIKAGSAAWVDVAYKANKPGVTRARLTVTAPAGASVIYPGEGNSSGLAGDSSLSVGETDSASVRIDTGTLAPGSYELQLVLSYGDGERLRGTATLDVN